MEYGNYAELAQIEEILIVTEAFYERVDEHERS